MAHNFAGLQREWARCAADSANPQMWDGLVSAWIPSLGNRSGQFMFDAGPVRRAAKGPTAPTWEFEPKIGLVSASNFSVYSHINNYVPLPVPELTVVSLFKTQASYGGSNYSVHAARHCYSGGSLGWRVGYWHPSSGVFSFIFDCANTGNDSWGTCPQPSTLLAGTWYLAVYRYNGKVKTVDVYKTDGTSASASSTLTNGGAINYYYFSQNDFSFFDITDSTRYGGVLIYGRDIGQRMSQQIGQGGPYGGGILRPFIPRAGKVFPVGSVAASYDVSGSSDLSASLSVIAALTNIGRAVAGTSTLSMTTAAALANFSLGTDATSTLDLTSTASFHVSRAVSATSTITPSVNADLVPFTVFEVGASSILAMSVAAEKWVPVHAVGAASTISLVQQAAGTRMVSAVAESVLQTATQEYDPELDEIITTYVGLQDSASFVRQNSPTLRHVIPLVDRATVVRIKPTAIDLSAASIIDLTDSGCKNEVGQASHQLQMEQDATVDKCKPIGSQLELTIAAGVSVIRNRAAGSVLALNQSVTFSLVSADLLHQYHPFIGEGAPGSPAPPPTTLAVPLAGITIPFQLVFPATGVVTDSVTLRAPNLGNKDRLSFNRVLRETRGGTLIVYADPIWPKIQTLALTFSGLRSTEVQDLLRFLDYHLGQQIGLLDWEHRYWVGVIMTPDDPVVQDDKNSFSASFEFEGELEADWSP